MQNCLINSRMMLIQWDFIIEKKEDDEEDEETRVTPTSHLFPVHFLTTYNTTRTTQPIVTAEF